MKVDVGDSIPMGAFGRCDVLEVEGDMVRVHSTFKGREMILSREVLETMSKMAQQVDALDERGHPKPKPWES